MSEQLDFNICPKCWIGHIHTKKIEGRKFTLIMDECFVCLYHNARKVANKNESFQS